MRVGVEIACLVAVPLCLGACAVAGIEQVALLSGLVVLASLALFFAQFERSRPRLRDTMPIAVLSALAVAGRLLFAPLPDVKPVSAIAIIAGASFGRTSGFMVGALTALVSNFFFGQGPWTPWQMYAWGLVGYLAGVLAQMGWFKRMPVVLGYGFVAALLYGAILNLWSLIGFFHPQTFAEGLAIYAVAVPLDVLHGVATDAFLLALYAPWKGKLERIKRKYALAE